MARSTLRGVIAPVLTPFNEDLSVDLPRYVEFCRQLLDEGCTGLAVFGTTSEANSLSLEEKLEMLRALVEGGIPPEKLMPGTGCCALPETVRLTRAAVEAGAGGVLLLPPFYYKAVSDDGLYTSVAETIRRVADGRLRVYLYHIPPVAQVGWPADLVVRLATDFPDTVVGHKDSGGDWSYTEGILKRVPGFAAFVGSELFLRDTLELGGAGTITATANVNAGALRQLYERWDSDEGEGLDRAVGAFRRTLAQYPLITALKAILARRSGHPGWNRVRPPLTSLPAERAGDLFDKLDALESLAPVG